MTLLAVCAYYDEDGNYHYNDPNFTRTTYTCSNGHSWVEETSHSTLESKIVEFNTVKE